MKDNIFYQNWIKGFLKTIILKLLHKNKSMYGYEITKQVEKISEGKIKLTFGAIYPTLHKLEKAGLLTSKSKEFDNRLRKYYSLTAKGKETVVIEVKEYEAFSNAVNRLILSTK